MQIPYLDSVLTDEILTLKDEIWTLNVFKSLFHKINTARH